MRLAPVQLVQGAIKQWGGEVGIGGGSESPKSGQDGSNGVNSVRRGARELGRRAGRGQACGDGAT